MERKKFLSGFLCGIAFTICIGTAVVAGNNYGLFDSFYQRTEGSEKITNAERRQVLKKLGTLEEYVDNYYLNDVTLKDYSEGLYRGYMSSLKDKYAAYYSKEEYDSVNESTEGKYVGIGCSIVYEPDKREFTLVQPYEGGPADKAGVRTGDVLTAIDGKKTDKMDLNQVVTTMKGKKGTEVTITILRSGVKEPMDFKITRDKVVTETVSSKMLENNIGYISISGFKENTVKQFSDAVDKLEKQGMQGLIIDERDNGGGSLSAVVSIADRILPEGLIVYTRDKNNKGEDFYCKDKKEIDLPIVLLVNENSASASEVLAGALKDHEVATLVGTKTFGKGIVQSIFPLSDGSAVKLTTSKYYTPNGNNIHEVGIVPDVKVELDQKYKEMEKPTDKDDNQLQTAITCMKSKLGNR